jgi:1-hydroxycarotenoid 3,4-desaturase
MPVREVLGINPFESYWHALGRYFKDPRLRQLFGRYATYCGSSPFKAPATLMLVADVEASGVWQVEGGMANLAKCLETCARNAGVEFNFNCQASRIELTAGRATAVIDSNGNRHACTSVIVNADSNALYAGLFGDDASKLGIACSPESRSLSAVTWCVKSSAQGVELQHHTVFFSDDYEKEFADLIYSPAQDPTVYICDQGQSRKLLLVNAPANGEDAPFDIDQRIVRRLQKCGLKLELENALRRSPIDFARLYPATNGALYGRASHGWLSTFQRPKARSGIPGLYLAGGSTHPGPGVPMAALAGLRAAEALMEDRALM